MRVLEHQSVMIIFAKDESKIKVSVPTARGHCAWAAFWFSKKHEYGI